MKVLIVGDSPQIKTGFGRVNAEAAQAFQNKGWEVASLGGLTDETTPLNDNTYGKVYVPSGYNGDIWGFHDVPDVIKDFKPDVLYTTADPGTFVTATSVIPADNTLVGYVPIEGEPMAQTQWRQVLQRVPFFTCSAYGAKTVKNSIGIDVDWVYHGIDHDVFNTEPRKNGLREQIRQKQGWENKFVIMVVATNVRRKQLPRVIEAVARLREQFKQKDIILYMHTVPFQHYWLEGWNLPEVSEMYGVADITLFNPLMGRFNAAVPELTGDPGNPGLAELYNAADLFVSASQVEGFGLPTAEAMACGLPVLVPKYAAGWEIATPAGRGILPKDFEVHKTSTRYANISPEDLAKEILHIKRNPKEAQRMSEAGVERAKDFQWSDFREVVVRKVEEFANGNQVRNTVEQADDQGPEAQDRSQPDWRGDSAPQVRNDQRGAEGQGQDSLDQVTPYEPMASQEEEEV